MQRVGSHYRIPLTLDSHRVRYQMVTAPGITVLGDTEGIEDAGRRIRSPVLKLILFVFGARKEGKGRVTEGRCSVIFLP